MHEVACNSHDVGMGLIGRPVGCQSATRLPWGLLNWLSYCGVHRQAGSAPVISASRFSSHSRAKPPALAQVGC
jgi:hypothetical protein